MGAPAGYGADPDGGDDLRVVGRPTHTVRSAHEAVSDDLRENDGFLRRGRVRVARSHRWLFEYGRKAPSQSTRDAACKLSTAKSWSPLVAR